ncbi:MAG: hypothetical protein ACPHJ3_14790, partial [Rubripirellula sp.]
MQANRCPSDAELLSLHSSSTSDLVRSEIAKHVDGCAYCQSKLAELNLDIIEKPALADDVTRIWQGTKSGQRGLGESETRHDSVGAAASDDEGGF